MQKINSLSKIKKKSGFTLAEILLVITLIGIVAMQTIPVLVTNTNNAATVAGVRKAQSELSQAYTSFIADGTTMDTVFAGNSTHAAALNRFIVKLNVIKKCGTAQGCFPDVDYTNLNDIPFDNYNQANYYAKAILADGSSIALNDYTGGCDYHLLADPVNPLYSYCAHIEIDINGFKGPNQAGRDMFGFWITRSGIVPYGSNGDSYVDDCDTSNDGWGCASRVLTDGAVNY